MSTSNDTGESDLCNCSICLVKYNKDQNKPKIYKCGHTVCEACTNKLWDKKTKVIRCPHCRSKAKISTIEDLTTNYFVLSFLDTQKPKDTAPVEHSTPCFDCAKKITLAWMTGPEKSCCDGCHQNFQKLAKDRHAKLPGKNPFWTQTKCTKHPDQFTEIICVDRKCTLGYKHRCVCATCFNEEHKGHTFKRIESLGDMVMNNFNNCAFVVYGFLKKESSPADVKSVMDNNKKGTETYERRLDGFKSRCDLLKYKAVELFEFLAEFQYNKAAQILNEQESRKRRSSTSKSDTTKRQKLPEEEIDIVQPNQSNVPISPGSSEFNPITLD